MIFTWKISKISFVFILYFNEFVVNAFVSMNIFTTISIFIVCDFLCEKKWRKKRKPDSHIHRKIESDFRTKIVAQQKVKILSRQTIFLHLMNPRNILAIANRFDLLQINRPSPVLTKIWVFTGSYEWLAYFCECAVILTHEFRLFRLQYECLSAQSKYSEPVLKITEIFATKGQDVCVETKAIKKEINIQTRIFEHYL